MARRKRRWCDVAFAGIAGSDHRALVLVSHEGIDRHEVQVVLRRRWPDAVLQEPEWEAPSLAVTPIEAARLGQHRRGVEPLRIVIMPQKCEKADVQPIVEPMPVVV
jgi:hypothetical protein